MSESVNEKGIFTFIKIDPIPANSKVVVRKTKTLLRQIMINVCLFICPLFSLIDSYWEQLFLPSLINAGIRAEKQQEKLSRGNC